MDGGGQGCGEQNVAARMGDVLAGRPQDVVGAERVDRHRLLKDRWVAADERELRGDPRVGDHDVQAPEL